MIQTEQVTIHEQVHTRTWSDANQMIQRDGALYEEAIDPSDSGRTYVETDQPIVREGEAEEADYLAALGRLGVSVDD